MYKIEFKMNAPICFVERPVFDGILAYCYARELLGDKFGQKLNLTQDEIIDFSGMPISMHPDGYFLASWMFWGEEIEFTGSWKKRWANEFDDIADFGKPKRKVRINAGKYKSYDMPMQLHRMKSIWFYFESEDPIEVKRLISDYLFGIGKKTSQGYGEFESFEISETKEKNFSKEVIRPVPVKEKDMSNLNGGMNLQLMGFRPPYWLPENQGFCLV